MACTLAVWGSSSGEWSTYPGNEVFLSFREGVCAVAACVVAMQNRNKSIFVL